MDSEDRQQEEPTDSRVYNAAVVAGFIIIFITLGILFHAIQGYMSSNKFSELGAQGDFFGGHFGPIFGSLTLIVVVYTSYRQMREQQRAFKKQQEKSEETLFYQSFIQGIDLISQWDRQSPGCPQAMRLVDYYAKVALRREEPELFRMLNTVITSKIRTNLEGGIGIQVVDNYPNAILALDRIAGIRRRDALELKAKHKERLDRIKAEVKTNLEKARGRDAHSAQTPPPRPRG